MTKDRRSGEERASFPSSTEAQLQVLVERLSETEAALAALIGGVDSVLDHTSLTPILLRQAQAELAASEERYYRLVSRMSAVVWEATAEGKVLFVSDAVTPVLGYAPADFIDHDWRDVLLPGELRSQLDAFSGSLEQGDLTGLEVVVAARDGSHHVLSLNSANRYDPNGKLERVVGVANDVTARKRAEAEQERHAQRLQILNQILLAILAANSAEEVALAALDNLHAIAPCDAASVVVYDHDASDATLLAVSNSHSAPAAIPFQHLPLDAMPITDEEREGRPRIIDDINTVDLGEAINSRLRSEGMRAHLSIPLMAEGALIGGLNLASRTPGAYSDRVVDMLLPVANSLAVAIQSAQLFARVRTSRRDLQLYSRQLVDAVESERRNISLELHDAAGQDLSALKLGLGELTRHTTDPASWEEHVNALTELTDNIMADLHGLAVRLRPASLDRLGLIPALEQYVALLQRNGGPEIVMELVGMDRLERLPAEVETAIYRVVQEALINVVRHVHANTIAVIVERQEGSIRAIVEDDGEGFEVSHGLQSGRAGLLGMRERAENLDGHITVESSPGSGTSVFVAIPLSPGNGDTS